MVRVLIADDDPQYLAAFRDAMEAMGHTALCVSSGDEVLDVLREEDIDILFLDVLMPRGGAISTIHAVRDRDATTPIVVITGNEAILGAPIMEDGMKLAQAKISKTASLSDLNGLIMQLI